MDCGSESRERAEMTRVTTVGRNEIDVKKRGQDRKFSKRERGQKGGREQRGHEWCTGGREELPADTSNKTKDAGRKHKHLAQLEREQDFQTIYG